MTKTEQAAVGLLVLTFLAWSGALLFIVVGLVLFVLVYWALGRLVDYTDHTKRPATRRRGSNSTSGRPRSSDR